MSSFTLASSMSRAVCTTAAPSRWTSVAERSPATITSGSRTRPYRAQADHRVSRIERPKMLGETPVGMSSMERAPHRCIKLRRRRRIIADVSTDCSNCPRRLGGAVAAIAAEELRFMRRQQGVGRAHGRRRSDRSSPSGRTRPSSTRRCGGSAFATRPCRTVRGHVPRTSPSRATPRAPARAGVMGEDAAFAAEATFEDDAVRLRPLGSLVQREGQRLARLRPRLARRTWRSTSAAEVPAHWTVSAPALEPRSTGRPSRGSGIWRPARFGIGRSTRRCRCTGPAEGLRLCARAQPRAHQQDH